MDSTGVYVQRFPVPITPLAVTVREFHTQLYPCSRAFAFQLVRSGELPSFRDGNRRMILYEDARAFILNRAARGGPVPPEVSAQKSAAGRKGKAVQNAMRRESEAA